MFELGARTAGPYHEKMADFQVNALSFILSTVVSCILRILLLMLR